MRLFPNDHINSDLKKFSGLRAIGFNVIASVIMAIGINVALSYPTQPVSHSSFFFPQQNKTKNGQVCCIHSL